MVLISGLALSGVDLQGLMCWNAVQMAGEKCRVTPAYRAGTSPLVFGF